MYSSSLLINRYVVKIPFPGVSNSPQVRVNELRLRYQKEPEKTLATEPFLISKGCVVLFKFLGKGDIKGDRGVI
jgi:hypothetical protein